MFVGLHTVDPFTGNVGDALITDAVIEIIEDATGDSNFAFEKTYYRGEDLTSRLDSINDADAILLTKARVTTHEMRPKKYPIAESLKDVEPPIVPMSMAYWFYPGIEEFIRYQTLHSSTKQFVDVLAENCPGRKLPVRSEWVGRVMKQNGYDTQLVGDPAWYHPEFMGESFHSPDTIDQLVVTPPHNEFYRDQCEELLSELSTRFPNATRVISYQSVLDDGDRYLRSVAERDGWEIHYASHDTSNLDIYHDSDLHIGYRKHGHLAHLRLRKPSLVIAEDSRGMGVGGPLDRASVPGFETRFSPRLTKVVDLFGDSKPAHAADIVADHLPIETPWSSLRFDTISRPNPDAVPTVLEFVGEQLDRGWTAYDDLADHLDFTYDESMRPFVSGLFQNI